MKQTCSSPMRDCPLRAALGIKTVIAMRAGSCPPVADVFSGYEFALPMPANALGGRQSRTTAKSASVTRAM
jgi:hypothetical protein